MKYLYDISENKKLYHVSKNEIENRIQNWSKNRPEDPKRVSTIQHYNKQFQIKHLDGIVYAWKNNDKYVIYDGWTRYTSADGDMGFLLCVYDTSIEQDIVYHFIALNSAVPVPSLYLESDMEKRNKVVRQVVENFCSRYPDFLSASRRPQKPNFNRDTFTEQLSNLDIENLDVIRLESLLEATNRSIEKTGTDFPEKARNKGLFMFADKKIVWQHYFNQELTNSSKNGSSWISRLLS